MGVALFFSRGEEGSLPPEAFFRRETEVVARELLGCRSRSTVGGVAVEGVIVETEAYVGPHDPASHAAARIGRTERNRAMFGPPGRAYVYRSYGIHWCLNVVTREEGFPGGGSDQGRRSRWRGRATCDAERGGRSLSVPGPGRLAQALGVTGELDGHSFSEGPLDPSRRVGRSRRLRWGFRAASGSAKRQIGPCGSSFGGTRRFLGRPRYVGPPSLWSEVRAETTGD